jgi:hypothetical protein
LDVDIPLEMSRGGADYRDAFRDDLPGTTHFERELGSRAFVAGHVVSLRSFVDTFLAPNAKRYETVAYLAQNSDFLSSVKELSSMTRADRRRGTSVWGVRTPTPRSMGKETTRKPSSRETLGSVQKTR